MTPLGPKVDAPEDLGFHEFAYVFLVGMGRNHQRLCCSVFLFFNAHLACSSDILDMFGGYVVFGGF